MAYTRESEVATLNREYSLTLLNSTPRGRYGMQDSTATAILCTPQWLPLNTRITTQGASANVRSHTMRTEQAWEHSATGGARDQRTAACMRSGSSGGMQAAPVDRVTSFATDCYNPEPTDTAEYPCGPEHRPCTRPRHHTHIHTPVTAPPTRHARTALISKNTHIQPSTQLKARCASTRTRSKAEHAAAQPRLWLPATAETRAQRPRDASRCPQLAQHTAW